MGQEIEHKFLVVGFEWKEGAVGVLYRQGYLSTHPERTVRVRIAGDLAYLTVKGASAGTVRSEYEYKVPLADANEMLLLCEKPLIEKRRYRVEHQGLVWEVDEFLGENEGLIVAEVELEREGQCIAKPPWVGEDVSDKVEYYNSSLVLRPYREWQS